MLKQLMFLLLLAGASTAWWNSSFQYRTPVSISNGGIGLSEHQINLSVDTSALIIAGKMQAGCEDIRFVASDDSSQLAYWIESGCNTTETKIWTKVSSIPAGASSIYMYYGNSSVPGASDGDATFGLFNVSGIAGFWHMDEAAWSGTSGEVKDETGVNNGTRAGDANTVSGGKFGRAGSFDGTGDYVNCANDTSLDVTGEITIEAWIKLASAGTSPIRIVDKEDTGWKGYLLGYSSAYNNEISFILGGDHDSAVSSASSITDTANFYHIAVTADPATQETKFYINGSLDVTRATNYGYLDTTPNDLWIGASSRIGSLFFDGIIDEVRVYDRALNATEVSAVYEGYMEKIGDWFSVRGYASSEPGVSVGSEETFQEEPQSNSTQSFTDLEGWAIANVSFDFTPSILRVYAGSKMSLQRRIIVSPGPTKVEIKARFTTGGLAVPEKQVTYTLVE